MAKKILIIDDEPEMLSLVKRNLKAVKSAGAADESGSEPA